MPILREFNTGSVRPWHKPQPDTHATLTFPRPLAAPSRIAHGFRQLDIGCNANIRARSMVQQITESHVDCHISTWADTTLYGGIDHVLALAPEDQDLLTGEHMLNLLPTRTIPFPSPPNVVVFFNLIALDKHHNWRLKTTATSIDANGFTLNIETWADTILYVAQACWIAYPADRKQIFSRSVNTTEVRHWSQPRLEQSKKIMFDSVTFSKDPSVFVALNSIDIGHTANLRINAYVDGVSRTGLVWHIDAWADTILYSAGASIIAFN
ncbi:hypothetical protein JVT61DRAFT_11899 [Boletus reticuloceps]|uniref:H-type lectin domain-containing protein n=1 Tax=Boletus reticuloceps TaxID=495285 RepID=A0A8I2YUC9_9AGAM|nr:hypothetical protein JVT61DRAFT_11899 [Boletus reticuloceps]